MSTPTPICEFNTRLSAFVAVRECLSASSATDGGAVANPQPAVSFNLDACFEMVEPVEIGR